MTTRAKIIIAVIVGGALLLGSYLLFFNSSSSSDTAVTASSVTTSADTAEVVFLNLANKTGSLNFDTSILSDPRFTDRINTQTTLTPESIGRRDPFGPVSGITSSIRLLAANISRNGSSRLTRQQAHTYCGEQNRVCR